MYYLYKVHICIESCILVLVCFTIHQN